MLAPEYGGDGLEVGDCAQYSEPLVAFPGHWAPNDLLFYTGDQFPEQYRNGVFVVFHGSWNRAPLEQGGYQVAFAPRANDEFTDDWQTFADGFKGATRLMAPQDATHRRVGIAQGPDGSVFVTDDVGGRLWRILYTGEREGSRSHGHPDRRPSLALWPPKIRPGTYDLRLTTDDA